MGANDTRPSSDGKQADAEHRRYALRLDGHLQSRWAAWFDALSLTNETDGTTLIVVDVVDQAALQGVLQRLRDVGVPLISLIQVPGHPDPSAPAERP